MLRPRLSNPFHRSPVTIWRRATTFRSAVAAALDAVASVSAKDEVEVWLATELPRLLVDPTRDAAGLAGLLALGQATGGARGGPEAQNATTAALRALAQASSALRDDLRGILNSGHLRATALRPGSPMRSSRTRSTVIGASFSPRQPYQQFVHACASGRFSGISFVSNRATAQTSSPCVNRLLHVR